jgi:nucleotide-binding universal stress UspA family protein
MRLKDILVHLDASEEAGTRLRLAADLARRHDAHLTALYVVELAMPVLVAGDPTGGGAALAELLEGMRQDSLADAARIEAEFRERLRLDGIAGEWRLVEGIAAEAVTRQARSADLVILGQENPEGGQAGAAAILEGTLFDSGRPVLAIPYAGRFETLGRRVLVGWNASREAARAVNDALPLIARADSTTVLSVNPRGGGPDGEGDQPGAEIALHLARHGVKVEVARTVAPEVGEGDVLLNRAADMGADLLVVGAYGHSRMRELVLGGVTRTLLRHMTLPVLLSH